MYKRIRVSLALVVSLLMVVGSPSLAPVAAQTATPGPGDAAQSGILFTLHPIDQSDASHFYVDMEPGSARDLTVVLGNRDQRSLTLRTYSADVVTLINGGMGVLEEPAAQSGPTLWIDYSAETVDLAPGESVERVFTVTVPEDTPPGEYLVGIALQTDEPEDVEGTTLFRQIIRKSIAVVVTVPGPVSASAEVGQPAIVLSGDQAILTMPLSNNGSTRLLPSGIVTMSDATGEEVMSAPIAMRPVYAGHQTAIEIALPSQLVPGGYTVNFQFEDIDTGWGASLSDSPVTLPEPEVPDEAAPVQITGASVTAAPDSASGDPPQYADVRVEIANRDAGVQSSRLTMVVTRDGEVVEDFVLSQNLALLEPTTTVEQRYIPAGGWEAGTWTFSLLLESVDPNSGVEAVLATLDIADEIVVSP